VPFIAAVIVGVEVGGATTLETLAVFDQLLSLPEAMASTRK
jgi:hypothetical protein